MYKFLILLFLFCKTSSSEIVKKDPPAEVYKEIKIGRAIAAKFIKKFGLVQDNKQTKYLNYIGGKIAELSPRQELSFKFGILNTKEVNAYACPGGYIFITKGALNQIENEAELAGVLAHEVSHVTLFHSGKFEGKEELLIDLVASMLSPGGDAISSVMEVASAELEEMMLENGRQKTFEIEADISGTLLLSQLGYDTNSYVNYLKRIKSGEENKVHSKTHPPVEERVSAIDKFFTAQKLSKTGKTNPKTFKENISKKN